MEVWLSILIGLLSIAAAIGVGFWTIRQTGSEIAKSFERVAEKVSENIERAIEAIHEDIKHSQEKLEKKLEE